jgi:hypothetical protein
MGEQFITTFSMATDYAGPYSQEMQFATQDLHLLPALYKFTASCFYPSSAL